MTVPLSVIHDWPTDRIVDLGDWWVGPYGAVRVDRLDVADRATGRGIIGRSTPHSSKAGAAHAHTVARCVVDAIDDGVGVPVHVSEVRVLKPRGWAQLCWTGSPSAPIWFVATVDGLDWLAPVGALSTVTVPIDGRVFQLVVASDESGPVVAVTTGPAPKWAAHVEADG